MRWHSRRSILAVVAALGALPFPVASTAARTGAATLGGDRRVAAAQPDGPSDPAELEAFLAERMATDMAAAHVPGAAVAVVKDGALLLAKGFGYADLAHKVPVDADRTVFPTGSVGKLFTWTAVMQLVEQGKLDLDADVNTYLDFRIPDTYPQPITLKDLMSHTAGFEERWFEAFARDLDDVKPVGAWLAAHIPARVAPPGEVAAYSNYGAMLAGYIVARVSGEPYEAYVQAHIFDPLGMTHSTARQPLPPDLRARASLGYWQVDGASVPVPRIPEDFLGQTAMVPAGGQAGTVTDMARFMIMHLQDGFYGDASSEIRILDEATARQMHSPLYTRDPRILGSAYGFFDFSDNGRHTIGHSGGTLGFTTLLLLVPDRNLGVYVVYNGEESGALTTQHLGFQRAFFDHYFPAPAAAPLQPPADFHARAGRFVGTYRSTRSAHTTLEKVATLMAPPNDIRDPGDGTLRLRVHGLEMGLVEVEPMYFRQVDGPLGFVFRADDRGRIVHMFADVSPQEDYEKLGWYEGRAFNLALLVGSLLVFLSLLLVSLVRAVRRRGGADDLASTPPGAVAAARLMVAICALNVLFVVGVAQMMMSLGFPMFGLSLWNKIVLGLGVLSALLTVGAIVYAVRAWRKGFWGTAFRVHYSLATVAAVAFVWFLHEWNLLGWRY